MKLAGWLCLVGGLSGCSSPGPARQTDPDIATAASSARLAFDQGQIERAAGLYSRGLTKARSMDDSFEIANNAYNLAACMMTLGRPEEARPLLQEAEREALRAGAARSDIRLMQAAAAQSLGQADEARTILKEVLSNSDRPEYRAQAFILEIRMACDAGDVAAAESRLKDLQGLRLDKKDNVLLQAEIEGLQGRLAGMKNQPGEAAGFMDRQADLLRQGGKFRDMAQALGRAGEWHGQAGQWPAAWDRAYRAARSLFAQGDTVGALRQVEQAVAAAEKTGAADAQAATATLFEDIRAAVKKAEAAE
ncbi:MAG TPA: hypothetical protein DCZ95_02755 [Verrucomicrobia bacterium]|nr:hypothetical protein [Verrucomicrobiota bacterium]